MLRKEVKNEQDSDVEDAIFDNKFFEIEEETIKELAKSTDWNYRRKAATLSKDSKLASQGNSYYRKKIAELSKDSNLLFEIFISEIEKGIGDTQILQTIIKNDKFPFKKTEV